MSKWSDSIIEKQDKINRSLSFVNFENKQYALRETVDPEGHLISVGTEDLEQALLKDGSYVSDLARQIDEDIYCYVSENALLNMDEENFKEYIACDFTKDENEFLP